MQTLCEGRRNLWGLCAGSAEEEKTKIMKAIAIAAAVLLLLAIAPLPIGYYTFLRIATTIAAVVLIVDSYKGQVNIWSIVFGIIAILFNPIIPIYLYQKDKWMPIDIGAAALFVGYAIWYKSPQINQNKGKVT